MKNALKRFLWGAAALVSLNAMAEDIHPTRAEGAVSVELVLYDSKSAVIAYCKSAGAWPQYDAETVARLHRAPGCNAFYPDTKRCVIHTLAPRSVEDRDRMENLGHEALHCFIGSYHG